MIERSERREQVYDVVVVGGGPAGLAAAWALRDCKVLVLEAADRLGGRLKSEPRGDYWLNLGAHLFPGPGSLVHGMLSELGLEALPIPGVTTALELGGRPYTTHWMELYPFRLPLSLMERYAFAKAGLQLRGAARRFHRLAEPSPSETEYESFTRAAQYLNDISLSDYLGRLPPRIESIFRCAGRRAPAELEDQSAGVGANLFAAVFSGKRSSDALNLRGGSSLFPQRIGRELGEAVICGARVTEVRTTDNVVRIMFHTRMGERQVVSRQAIVATPAFVTRSIVKDLPDDLDRVLASVTYGPFVCMGMLTTERGPMPWDHLYAMTTPGLSFNMFFNHANPLRTADRRPGGSLMVYAGGRLASELLGKTDDEIERQFRKDLNRLYPELDGVVGEAVIQRWEQGNPYRHPGMSFEPMLKYSASSSTMHFAGDYFAVLGGMESAARSGTAAARMARRALQRARGSEIHAQARQPQG